MSYTCPYCHHHCTLQEGKTGFCRVRTLQDGKNVCGNYGFLTSLALDPIEKKPLNRFYPGTTILSLGSYGCNLRCPFCQNLLVRAGICNAPAGEGDPAGGACGNRGVLP